MKRGKNNHWGPGLAPVGGLDQAENGFHGGVLARGGVEHGVIEMARGPLRVVVMPDEGHALLIHRVNQMPRLGFIFHFGQDALVLQFARGVEEDAESVGPIPQEVGGGPPDNHALARRRRLLNDLLGEMDKAVGIHDVGIGQHDAALVAAAPEDFGQAVEPGINPFLPALAGFGADFGQLGDFPGQSVVEQFPAQPVRDLVGDGAGAGAKFTFDDNDSFHWSQH